ncbi:hypothetical protein JCM19037_3681 [Geomicrobium sp. JCM 19037]|uniref:replication protein n=1 Tax=Geomicrobium sp. JCM 19037 TaxID=1460634 RepID=UPI00045F1B83|nr:replication protein [Geomicrobium sp. JCM 19037]GAK05203.1 hypothetical protein JCM19037_3681 [Geomicrobium sp. JCM 19037]
MANPQKEQGYTAVANEILEEVAIRKFSSTQHKILLVIWRYTYGFHRKSHAFSISFVQSKTGLSKDASKRGIKSLIDKNVITVVKEASFNGSRELMFNKDYETWKIVSDAPENVEEMEQNTSNNSLGADSSTGGGIAPPTGSAPAPPTGGGSAPQLKKEKESKERVVVDARKETPFSFFEQNFHILNGHIQDKIGNWCDDLTEEVVMEAMKITSENGVRKFSYTESILREWFNHSLTDIEKVRAHELHKKEAKPNARHGNNPQRDMGKGRTGQEQFVPEFVGRYKRA